MTPEHTIRIYEELAHQFDRQGETHIRDRLLILAADAAYSAGKLDDAERLRSRLLELNPHHMLKPFASLAEALQSTDVRSYIEGLRRTYPREQAEQMLSGDWQPAGQPQPTPQPAPQPTTPWPASTVSPPIPFQMPPPIVPTTSSEPAMPVPMNPSSPSRASASKPAEISWLATALLWLVLNVSSLLLIYTFARPFLKN
ncbi:MAG: hypothetical protein KatS3mg105_1780 [Gemmatales bacterium]|nr:MAG: hypothetical protein KatS3mg105_1780 [Gemmatales bacterium]